MGSLSFLQGIFQTQGLNPCLLHWQADFFFFKPPSHQGSIKTKWVWLVISQILKSQSGKIHPKWKQNKTLILGPKVSLSFTEVKVLFYLKGKKMLRFMFLHSNNVTCLLKWVSSKFFAAVTSCPSFFCCSWHFSLSASGYLFLKHVNWMKWKPNKFWEGEECLGKSLLPAVSYVLCNSSHFSKMLGHWCFENPHRQGGNVSHSDFNSLTKPFHILACNVVFIP